MMYEYDLIQAIIEIYSMAVHVTVMYFENNIDHPVFLSSKMDYVNIMEFAEFSEILLFLESLHRAGIGNEMCQKVFHTYYTKSFFAYNIVILNTESSHFRALVAGPLLTFLPDDKLFEDILLKKSLSYQKKTELFKTLSCIPSVSEAHTSHLGKLLLALTCMDGSCLASISQALHGQDLPDRNGLLRNFAETALQDREKHEYYSLYMLTMKLKEKIMQGTVEGIAPMIIEHINQFWNTRPDGNNYRALKNKCLMICSTCSVFAAQTDASYERIISTLSNMSAKMEKQETAAGSIQQMITAIETFAYLVSIRTTSNYSLHIKRVLQYIRQHYTEKITLGLLAEYIQVTPEYLSGLIKKETNSSLMDLIHHIRIEESKFHLIHTGKSMQEIAHEIGFSYQNHFCHIFKKLMGMTPSEYRHTHSKNNFI